MLKANSISINHLMGTNYDGNATFDVCLPPPEFVYGLQKETTTGQRLCFINGLALKAGYLSIYGLAMISVLTSFIMMAYFACVHVDTDMMKLHQTQMAINSRTPFD